LAFQVPAALLNAEQLPGALQVSGRVTKAPRANASSPTQEQWMLRADFLPSEGKKKERKIRIHGKAEVL